MEFLRTQLLLGAEHMQTLASASVAVFGIGGVGSYAAEALARCGIGRLTLVDNDVVDVSNINRQIIALHSTVGRYKTEVMKERIEDINPAAEICVKNVFFNAETVFDFSEYDYIIDAIDTVSSKLIIIERALHAGTPVISSMGTGNKLHPEMFEITDISKTSVCPLARVMRYELKKRGIQHVKVLFSKELPVRNKDMTEEETQKRRIPGSIAFTPSAAGLMIAGETVRDLLKI